MFIAKVFNVYKLTVTSENEERSFTHFARHKRDVLYFKTREAAEAYKKEHYQWSEFLIEEKLAITHQGRTKLLEEVKPSVFRKRVVTSAARLNPIFWYDINIAIETNGPGHLIAAKEVRENEYKAVDFTADASHFVLTNPMSDGQKTFSIVKKLKLVPITYTPVHTPSELDIQEEKYLAARRVR